MSYSPLPATFLDDLNRLGDGLCVEIGCGDGRFSRVLAAAGASALRLDRRGGRDLTVADVVAEARALPLPDGSVSLLVAGSLLRHLWPLPGRRPCPDAWLRCLAPGGALWIFEDEPAAHPAPARHYRDAMEFLARVAPGARRPLLPLGAFLERIGPTRAKSWRRGTARNAVAVENAEALARLLEGESAAPQAEGAALAAAIRRDGLSYGTFWWARFAREAP